MMRKIFLGVFLLGLAASPAAAQSTAGTADLQATEQRLKVLREQISQFEGRLAEAAMEERSATDALEELDREIQIRQELVDTYVRRARQLQSESDTLRASLSGLERSIDTLRVEYAGRAEYVYKHGRVHDLALIVSSESINQMLIRIRYLKRFADQRKRRLGAIKHAGTQITRRRERLQETMDQNRALLEESRAEQQRLGKLAQERQQLLAGLRQRRSTIERELEQRRRDAEQWEARLRQFITADTERRRAREAADPAAAAETIQLSGSFIQNRGQLPWPVEGIVTEPYGIRVHPVHGTKTPNPGLEISTTAANPVRSVFDGTVTQVFSMPGYGTCIMVRHGDYTTVYGNLSAISVREGVRVRAGQPIGRAGTTNEPRGAALFFALFTKDGRDVDPAPWLRGR